MIIKILILFTFSEILMIFTFSIHFCEAAVAFYPDLCLKCCHFYRFLYNRKIPYWISNLECILVWIVDDLTGFISVLHLYCAHLVLILLLSDLLFVKHILNTALVACCLSHIVNGHKLLCSAHAVSEQHRGTAALFIFYSLSSFSSFSFYVFVTPFLGCLYSLC